jgi:hypothetical protein
MNGFLTRDTVLLPFTGMELFCTDVMFLTLENPEMQAELLSKLTQFSQGNNVLDPPASNIDRFLARETVFLPFTGMEIFCTDIMFLTAEYLEMSAVFTSKGN